MSSPKWMRRRGPTELVMELKTIRSGISEQSTCSCIHSSRSVFCCSRTPSFSWREHAARGQCQPGPEQHPSRLSAKRPETKQVPRQTHITSRCKLERFAHSDFVLTPLAIQRRWLNIWRLRVCDTPAVRDSPATAARSTHLPAELLARRPQQPGALTCLQSSSALFRASSRFTLSGWSGPVCFRICNHQRRW